MPTEYSPEQLAQLPKTVFLHGIASGDPLTDRAILWTRVTSNTPGPVEVRWEISRHADFKTLLSSGTAAAVPENDYCVHVDVDGLQPKPILLSIRGIG